MASEQLGFSQDFSMKSLRTLFTTSYPHVVRSGRTIEPLRVSFSTSCPHIVRSGRSVFANIDLKDIS